MRKYHIDMVNEDDDNNITHLDSGKSYVKWSTKDNLNLI